MYGSRTALCFLLPTAVLLATGEPITAKLIKPDRWGSGPLLHSTVYPTLAGLAKIQGDVIAALIINNSGKVDGTKSYSGPPQLRQFAESMAATIEFQMAPTETESPWLFFVTVQFKLPARTVTIIPTPSELIPLNLLKPSSK